MKNFINVRIQSYNAEKERNGIKHNLRLIKSPSQNKEKTHENIYLDRNFKEIKTNKEKHTILMEYDELRKQHNDLFYKRTGKNLRNRNSTFCSGVFSFSEKLVFDMKENKITKEKLIETAKDTIKQLENQFGIEVMYLTLHMDEKTPHFQFHFRNFDENGKSIFHKMKNSETLSRLQDIGHENFGKLGMDRGIKKKDKGIPSSYDYKTIKQYHAEKETDSKRLIELLKEMDRDLKDKRKEISKTDTEYQMKKQLYDEITEKQKKIRLERDELIAGSRIDAEKIVSLMPSIKIFTNENTIKEIQKILLETQKKELLNQQNDRKTITELKEQIETIENKKNNEIAIIKTRQEKEIKEMKKQHENEKQTIIDTYEQKEIDRKDKERKKFYEETSKTHYKKDNDEIEKDIRHRRR